MTEIQQMQRITPEQLRGFFRPKSIALIGATDNSRWSLYTFENLQRFAFPGPIHLVHPTHEVVHGQRAIPSLRELAEPVDLAFVMVPTRKVLPVVQEAVSLGTRHVVVLTAGFGEVGVEGAQYEQELLAYAREHDVLLLGPNGNGFVNITERVTPYGLPLSPALSSGPVGVVLQSGALASAVMAFAQAHRIGLSLLVSMGNESMLSVTDVVDYLLEDEATRVIALFLESVRQPEELRRVARKAQERGKPIVVFKIGRSERSARTALAHTGALVGNDAVNDAAFRQLGIIRTYSLEDLLITAGLFGSVGALPGRRMGVVTPSGGACDILSDLAQDEGIELPEFAPETLEGLRAVLPPFSTPHNPLDVTGYVVVDATLQRRALQVVLNDSTLDFVLYLASIEGALPPAPEQLAVTFAQYDLLTEIIRGASCPVILVSNTCLDITPTSRLVAERTGLSFVAGMEHGIRAIARVLWWSEHIHQASAFLTANTSEAVNEAVAAVPFERVGTWSEAQARQLLQEADLPIIPGILATSADEAVQAARSLGLPVALKVQSASIVHKSDVGGVVLHLDTEEAVGESFQSIMEQVRSQAPDARIDGILVSPMRSTGVELLVSVMRDELWGPVLTLGLGGIWTEVLKDTSVRVLPVSHAEILTMLGELRGSAVLRGNRGQAAVDLHALSMVISRISQLASSLGPQLATLEINPLWTDGTRIEILDALVSWQ